MVIASDVTSLSWHSNFNFINWNPSLRLRNLQQRKSELLTNFSVTLSGFKWCVWLPSANFIRSLIGQWMTTSFEMSLYLQERQRPYEPSMLQSPPQNASRLTFKSRLILFTKSRRKFIEKHTAVYKNKPLKSSVTELLALDLIYDIVMQIFCPYVSEIYLTINK